MQAAEKIRNALAQVAQLQNDALANPPVRAAVLAIKSFQTRRFGATYADLTAGDQYRAATHFFLTELYGETDFGQRDAQFSRVAGALQRLLPQPALATAVALAQLHASSEGLDHAMARAWVQAPPAMEGKESARYIHAWRAVGCRDERDGQLKAVLGIGASLEHLTRTPGLRLLLKMMRGAAQAAGLGALQRFLELGFDTFAAMARREPGAKGFLAIIQARESRLIDLLFDADLEVCRAEIDRTLATGSHCARRPAGQ